VASFAFGQRHAVLDTNVRRVLARLVSGSAGPTASAASVAEIRLAESLLPAEPAIAARWSVAVMELGAIICTAAAAPRCAECPLRQDCAWLIAGRPDGLAGTAGPGGFGGQRRAQRYDGTDRQCRGRLLAALRSSGCAMSREDFDPLWPDQVQLDRALRSLIADGLVEPVADGRYALPGDEPS
jgi:A/G-specific adenine glycosylase